MSNGFEFGSRAPNCDHRLQKEVQIRRKHITLSQKGHVKDLGYFVEAASRHAGLSINKMQASKLTWMIMECFFLMLKVVVFILLMHE